ncbi:MAG: ferredoxin [Vampirovibrio sp.]|jgi:ferredoxin|nr:ferredoxin [Vampirovibrio sp.]
MYVHIVAGCIACGACESICPNVFTVYDTAEANNENVPGFEAECRDAASACPVSVIKIEE